MRNMAVDEFVPVGTTRYDVAVTTIGAAEGTAGNWNDLRVGGLAGVPDMQVVTERYVNS